MNNKITRILLIITLLLFLGIAFFFIAKKTYNTGFETNKTGFVIVSGRGKVEKIDQRQIVISKEMVLAPEQEKNKQQNFFNFAIDAKTKFYKLTKKIKSEQQFLKEQQEINNLISYFESNGRDVYGIEPVIWNLTEKIDLESIKQGDIVSIYTDSEYKNKNGKIALKIIVDLPDTTLAESLLSMGKVSAEITGKINAISGQQIDLAVNNNPLSTSSDDVKIKKIQISTTTKFYKAELKTAEQFEKEQAEFNQKLKQAKDKNLGTDNIIAPEWYKFKEVGLVDFVVGQSVSVKYYINDDSGQIIADKITVFDRQL